MKIPKNLGRPLLAVWFILFGLLTAPALALSFAHSVDLLAVFAVVVGIVLLIQRWRSGPAAPAAIRSNSLTSL